MNENKKINISKKTGVLLLKSRQLSLRILKWLRKEIAIVIGAIIILIITLTITQATPISRWMAATSTNCLAQGLGNTMVENNGLIYILFGNSNNFRSFNPSTGNCNSTALANFPSSSVGQKLIVIDADTLYATTNTTGYYYHIRDNFWSFYPRSQADNSVLPQPIAFPTYSQGYGNSIAAYNNELYVLAGANNFFEKYSPSTNSWTTRANITGAPGSGGAFIYPGSGTYLYALRGNTYNNLYRYDPAANSWATMANAPGTAHAGGAMTAVNGTDLYVFGGNNTTRFWKYNIAGNTWADLVDYYTPDRVYGGAAMTSIGSKIYALQGNLSRSFWEFDTSLGTPAWVEKTDLPKRASSGAALTTDGTYIYATSGKKSGDLFRYDPALDSWTQLTTSHTGTSTDVAGYGIEIATGGMTYVAVGPSGGPEIYFTTGYGATSSCGVGQGCRDAIVRYVISSDTWPVYKSSPNFPTNVSSGASAAYPDSSDNIFVLMGFNSNNFWKFMMSQNIFLPVAISKFNATDVIATVIPGLTGLQSTGSSITRAGNKLYLALSAAFFVEYDPLTNQWTVLPKPPISVGTGGALTTYDDNTLFLSTGVGFYKYDIPNSTWFHMNLGKTATGEPIAQIMDESEQYSTYLNQGYGSNIIENNGELFVIQGGAGTRFSSYNPAINRWTLLANVTGSVSNGGNSVAVGKYIFTLRGGNTNGFYRYDTTENTWATMASASQTVHYGGSSAYPGGDFIYALPGNRTNGFMRYCYQNTGSGCTANTWTNLISTMPPPHTIHTGAAMTDLNSTTLYAMAGNNTNFFMRFDITDSPSAGDGVWTDLTSIDPLPETVASGASLTSDGTYLYASRGRNTSTMWRYDPTETAGSRWSIIQNAPVNIGYSTSITDNWGGIIYSPTLGEIYAITGYGKGGFSQDSGIAPGLIYRYQLPASNGPPADDFTWPHFPATASPPSNFANGAALTRPTGSDYIYAFRGNATTHFWRYHVPDNQWKIIYQSKLDNDTPVSQGPLSQSQGPGNSITEVNGVFYVLNGNSTNIFQKYTPSTNTWTSLSSTPANVTTGGSIVKIDNDNLYAFNGGSTIFWRYHIPSDQWIPFNTATLPNGKAASQNAATQNQGGTAVVKANDPATGNPNFFVLVGAYVYTFQKFDPFTNTWFPLTDAPSYSTRGSAMVNIGTDIYCKFHGNSSFYKYDIYDNTWSTLTSAPATTYGGNDLAYPGSGDYIYMFRGGTTSGNMFYRYSISGNSWTTLAVAPANTYAGSSLSFLNSNDLYALGGYGTRNFWKYDVALDSWDTLTTEQPPFISTVQAGGSLTTDGTYLYATVGGTNNREFWRYDPAGTSGSRWTRYNSTAIGSTGDLPANMGLANTTSSRGNITLCDNCAGTGMNEIWAITGNGVTGYPVNDNAGVIFRFRIDPVTCDATGENPGTGSNPCNGYNSWLHFPKPALTPAATGHGASLTYPGSGNLIYAFRGAAQTTFWAYNMVTNAWSALTIAPGTISGGSALTSYINGLTSLPDIYALRGGSNTFWLYRVTDLATGAGTWNPTDPADKTGTIASSGASLTTDGTGNVYATGGNSTAEIYRYEIATDTWSSTSPASASLTFPSPLFIGASSSTDARGGMAYTASGPSGGPELFAVTGGGNSGGNFASPVQFAGLIYRYPLTTGVNVGTWPISYTPAAQPATGKTINFGGALVSTDSNSIFALRGNNTNEFWRYDVGNNSWNHTLPTIPSPATIGAGGALAYDGINKIFATRGSNNKTFYQYTVDNGLYPGAGIWSTLPDSPVTIQTSTTSAGGGLAYTDFTPDFSGDENIWMATGYGRSVIDNSRTAQLLYRYDVDLADWPHYAPASNPPLTSLFNAGSDLALNENNTEIYAIRGTDAANNFGSSGWSVSNPNFWKYTIATDTWAPLTNVYSNTAPKRVFSGGSITSSSLTPDTLYMATGGTNKDILKYNISTDSWEAPSTFLFPYPIGTMVNSSDGGELIYSPSTEKLFATTGTDITTPFTIYYLDLANRAVPTLNSPWASTDSAFNILVTATDREDNPINVSQNTQITLSLTSGSGTLGGNLSGTIPSGQSTVLISGVTYDIVEPSITIAATDTSASPSLIASNISFPIYGTSPTISTVSPNSGSTGGGAWVTITGSNFVEGSYVNFNGTGAPDTEWISSTELRVLTPAFATETTPLAVEVMVVTPSGQNSVLTDGFTYVDPTITSITPDSIGTGGRTSVTITGSNLGPNHYYRQLYVSNVNDTLTDYVVPFQLDTTTLIADGKMKADCGDMRVFDDGLEQSLNYWIQDNTCNTETTKVWVKIPSLPNGGKTLRLTYGNPTLVSRSDGDSVFMFFDDFEGPTLNTSKWTSTSFIPTVNDGKLVLRHHDSGGTSRPAGIFAGVFPIPGNTVWETLANPVVTNRTGNVLKGATNSSSAWNTDASTSTLSLSWRSTTLWAESIGVDISMGSYAANFLPYKVIYRPEDNNQAALYQYNNGAYTTIYLTEPENSLYPTLYVNGGSFEAYWEFIFIRPYGGTTEPSIVVDSENGGNAFIYFTDGVTIELATDYEFIDSTTVRARAPSLPENTYNIEINSWDSHLDILTNGLMVDGPSITEIIPNIGTTAGGSEITISGSNFVEGGFRRPITITNKSRAPLSDQTLYFTVDTASLILGGKLQSDCRDVRVTDADHQTPLNHWIESCNSTSTRIWVQIPSIPPAGQQIYLHYGNVNYLSAATPENFFPTLASTAKVLWLKSDHGVTLNGSTVSAWNDQSGSDNHVIQGTTINQPAYGTVYNNGIPAISFDGTNDFLARTGFFNLPTGNANRSAFMVSRYDKAGFGGFAYGNNATLATFGLVASSNTSYAYLGVQGYGTDYLSTTSNALYQGILLHTAILNHPQLQQFRNGNLILNTATTAFNTATTKIEIGREIDGTPYLDMDIFEILVFNRTLTTAERQEVENYLTLKYNLNNNIPTSTYTGPETGVNNGFAAYIEDPATVQFTNFHFRNSESIIAITPPHAPGTVDVSYVVSDIPKATAVNSYTFADPPTITSITAATGTNGEILSVDLIGTNITTATQIALLKTGQEEIICSNYINITATTLTCDLDLRNARKGLWDVLIYTPGVTPGTNSTLAAGFEITASAPVIYSLSPPGGSTLGGTAVTITGNYFVDKGGNYTTPISITNSSGEQTDYQVRFTLDTATAITAGKMRSDCGDIRIFSDPEHYPDTSLPYYLENGCNSASTVIWTKVPNIAANATTTLYVNYGLANRASASNGDDVFLFFDDFEEGTIDLTKWIPNQGSNPWLIETINNFQGNFSTKNNTYVRYNTDTLISRDGLGLINVPSGKSAIIDFYWTVNSYSSYGYLYYCSSSGDSSTPPSCSSSSGYANRISGSVAWTREMSTSQQLGAGLHRILFGYYHGYSSGNNTGQIDAIKVRLYSSTISDGVAGTELVAQNSPIVTFDTLEATSITYVDSSTLLVVAPPHAAGLVDVTVTNPDLQSGLSPTQFAYAAPPVITAISPDNGLTTQSALTVTISGTDLVATPTAKLTKARYSDIICTNPRNFVAGSPDTFQCDLNLTGAHNGTWNLIIQNPDLQTATLTDGFTINYPPPVAVSINPNFGPSTGGTVVTVSGSDFMEGDIYSVRYPINYAGSDLTNYQLQLTLNTTTPISQIRMREDCADIRAFAEDQSTPINFYIQNPSACNTATPLNIWVKVPSIPDGGTSVYLKYGDPAWTTDASDATNTFVKFIPNALAEWKMDEISGSTVIDGSSGNNHGTAIGTTIVDGKFGKARKFQGSPDYINFGVNQTINPSGTEAEHTMEAWIKLEGAQSSYPTLFNLWEEDGVNDKSYLLDFPSQTVRYYVRNAANSTERVLQTGNLGLYDDQWHHILVTNSRSGGLNYLRIYVDGVLRSTSTGSNYGMRTTLPTINLQMAKQTWSGFQGLWGLIDDARVYNRALTQEEVTALFNNYSFIDPQTNSILVTQASTFTPTIGVADPAVRNPPTVSFGAVESPLVVYLNSTTLEATSPPGSGTVDVTVTNPDSQSDTLTAAFTYTPPPTITSIAPATALVGSTVTGFKVYGSNFVNTPTVRIYQLDLVINCANVVLTGTTEITCDLNLTGLPIGLYNVLVTNPDTQSDHLVEAFEILPLPPIITSIDPTSGTTLGGTFITVTGQNFYEEGGMEGFMRSVTINNTGTAQTNYQYNFLLDTAALIAAGKMRSDCGDIRVFADENFSTPLPYYLESSTCNSASTSIWTKIPTISASGNTIFYITYAAPELTSTSNGNNVFILYDDFEGGSIDSTKWDVGGTANWMIDSTDKYEGTYSSRGGVITHSQTSYIASKAGLGLINVPTNHSAIIDFYWKVSSEGGYDYLFYCTASGDSTLPGCTRGSIDVIHRIAGAINWGREQSSARTGTGGILSSGLYRLKFAYEKDSSVSTGSDTGWIDLVRVRLYSSNVNTTPTYGDETEMSQPLKVTFGGISATDLNLISSTTLELLTPPGTGQVDVTVTNPDLQSDTLINGYTYIEPPTVLSITPVSGITTEAIKTVTITGNDFQATPTAKLAKAGQTDITCTNPRNFVDGSPDSFQCDLNLTTATSDGAWNVVVTNPDLQTATLTDGFAINYPPPTIVSVVPNQGFSEGGNNVTINGTGFRQDTSFGYVVPVTISNSGTTQNDFQVQISVNTAALISAGKMNADCSDIRLYSDLNFTNNLPYYLENGCNTTTTSLWTKVPTLADSSDTDIYLNYGRPLLTDASSGDDVFLFFDDFEEGTIDLTKWIPNQGSNPWLIETINNFQGNFSSKNNAYTRYNTDTLISRDNLGLINVPTGKTAIIDFYWTVNSYWNYGYLYYCSSSGDSSTPPSCSSSSGYANRITGSVAWTREMSTSQQLGSGLNRILFGYYHGYGELNNTGQIDAIKVRLYSTSVTDGILGIETVGVKIPTVTFDGVPATNVVFISDTSLTADTPAGTGLVDVTVTNPDLQPATLTDGYTYIEPPTVLSIIPNTGHNQESLTGVVINGSNFVATPIVTLYIGETPLSCTNVTFVDSTQLTCDLNLNGAFVGNYNVIVRNPDTQQGLLMNGFTVTYPQPTITNIAPIIGFVAGGATVTITGTFFENGADVDFDGVYSPSVTFISAGELQVQTPAHTIGLKDVTVTNPNLMFVTAIDGYEYIDPPVPTSIVPNSGSNDQSSYTVTVYGSNFVSPSAAKLSLSGQSDITCSNIRNFIDNTPPTDDSFQCDLNLNGAERGQWNLSMTNSNGQVGSLENAFTTTFAPPTVTSITPDEVASGSTQSVTISGNNFYSEDPDFIEATIGGTGGVGGTVCTSPVVVNMTTLTCNLPALTAGPYDITVTTGTGSNTLVNAITYFDSPTITLVTPDSGSTTGGTAITLTGTNFFGTPTVLITRGLSPGAPATDVIVVNSTTITAVTPPSTEGPVDVTVVTDAGTDTLNAGFTYIPPPADPDASTIEIFAYRIEPVNNLYYNDTNLSPVHASLIRVRGIESLTGNLIIGREVNLAPDPATDLLIRGTDCSNIYAIGATSIATTDAWGTACFLVWSTAANTFDAASSTIGATIAAGASSNPVTIDDTVTLEIEPLAMTSVLNYRFRNDDGTELTASPITDTSTPLYRTLNSVQFRLRLGITRFLENASSFARNDEFTLSGRSQIGPRPLPAASPEGISSLRAFPGYAIDETTNTLYLATPNRNDSKARVYRYNLTDLTLPATYFEFPAIVNFASEVPDELDAPIDGGTHLITRMFIDSNNDLMYFVLTPYFSSTGLTRVYKVDLLTGTVIDVYAELVTSAKSSLDAEIDLDNGFLYLTVGTPVIPGDATVNIGVQKIDLKGRNEAMTLVGELLLENTQSWATSSVIDLTNQFLYVTGGYPHKIFKVDLDVDPSLPPVKVDEIALVPLPPTNPDEMVGIQAAVIDPVEGFAYFAGSTDIYAPGYDENNQKAFLTKVDIDPTRTFSVISRLSLNPPSLTADNDFQAEYAYLPPNFEDYRLYGYASLDRVNGYAYFPLARHNKFRDTVTWKLMRIHLDTFTRDSVYDELLFPAADSASLKGTAFFPEIGRGYLVREMTDGDWLYEFNSTTRQNFKLQSSPNVDPLYCNYASNDLYTWSDLPNTDFELVASTNFTDGDPTSNVTGLLYDNNAYFRPGEIKDSSATTGRISLGQNEFTEIEYSLAPTVNAKGSYCLRLVDADPQNKNQVSGYPNLIYNIITPQFDPTSYHHYVPITINGVQLEKNEVNVVEGSSSDSYGIRLGSQPTAEVIITVTALDNRLILTPDETPLTPQETQLTFNSGNWDTWQYINTSALDNGIINGTSIEKIMHSAVSTDPGYDNIIIEPVQSIVTDYGATIANVLATVSGTITFTPPTDFSFPDVTSGANEPNFSPTLTVGIQEGRGTAYDFVMTLQTDGFCRTQTVCLPLDRILLTTSNLINSFNTFNAAQIAQFMANYLQDGESLSDRSTYVHVDPQEDRSLAAPVTLFDSRNVPSGNSDNPLQGTTTFGLNMMIDFANITGLSGGNYRSLLTIDLNTNPL